VVYGVNEVNISPDIIDARRERARGQVAEEFFHLGWSAVDVSPRSLRGVDFHIRQKDKLVTDPGGQLLE
jgi:hypothetical protein